MFFTVVAFSNHWRTFVGFFFICCSRSSKMASFCLLEFAVVRFRLSSTIEKPLSTSVEMFSASIAMRTTYIKLIIFWRGDTGLFFIAICYFAILIVVFDRLSSLKTIEIYRIYRVYRNLFNYRFSTFLSVTGAAPGAATRILTVIASIMRP